MFHLGMLAHRLNQFRTYIAREGFWRAMRRAQYWISSRSLARLMVLLKHGELRAGSATYFQWVDDFYYRRHVRQIGYRYLRPPYKTPEEGTIALLFFMGIGDYFYLTPALRALRLRYQEKRLLACVSDHADTINNPLVASLLRRNPNIDQVLTYHGAEGPYWKSYQWQDALGRLPPNSVVWPVVFSQHRGVVHRTFSALESFGLPHSPALPAPAPLLDLEDRDFVRSQAFIEEHQLRRQRVSFVHLSARSGGYVYPDRAALLDGLLREGYLPVVFDGVGAPHPGTISIPIQQWTLQESIALVQSLKESAIFLCIDSLFISITAATGIPTLAIMQLDTFTISQLFYPSLHYLTGNAEAALRFPAEKVFFAGPAEVKRHGGILDYPAGLVLKCLALMTKSRPAAYAGTGAPFAQIRPERTASGFSS